MAKFLNFLNWFKPRFNYAKAKRGLMKHFALNPQDKEAVIKAAYAYHDWPNYPDQHSFDRKGRCSKCGRSRDTVRWDNQPPQCDPVTDNIHRYTGAAPWATCVFCGATREVNGETGIANPFHYGQKPCSQSKPGLDTESVILREEERVLELSRKAATHVPKLIDKLGLSGKTLAILHHTHGYDPDTVSALAEVTPQLWNEYCKEMELHKACG